MTEINASLSISTIAPIGCRYLIPLSSQSSIATSAAALVSPMTSNGIGSQVVPLDFSENGIKPLCNSCEDGIVASQIRGCQAFLGAFSKHLEDSQTPHPPPAPKG